MEENKDDTPGGGEGESETKLVCSVTNDEVHVESNDDTKSDPVNDPHDAQHSGKSERSTEGEAETKTASEASDDKDIL
ncbi:uncharacterized protein PAE49_023221 isoform 3-T3 [Odontesthes bonariensis]